MWNLNKIFKKKEGTEMTFNNLANEWLEYKKNSIKESTYYNYLLCIENYLQPNFKDLKLNETINYHDLINKLSETLAPKTIKDIITILKSIFKYYEEEYETHLKIKKANVPKLARKKLKILTKSEKNKMESYCIKHNDLKEIGIIICLNTGLRIGEICGLKLKDINFEKKLSILKELFKEYTIKNLIQQK